jgi:hypothetical protein
VSLKKPEQNFPPEQLPLYRPPQPDPGSMNDEGLVRAIVTGCIRKSSKSRGQISEEMSRLTGSTVTVRMLNSYTSEAAEQHRWPSQYTRAFCYVVEDWSLLRCIVERAGFHMITQAESDLLALGREFLRQKRAGEKMASIEAGLRGVDEL